MAVGNFTAGEAVSQILAKDENRAEVLVQWYDGGGINVAFGADPEAGKGIELSEGMPAIIVNDHRAYGEVRVIRSGDVDGLGGWQTT